MRRRQLGAAVAAGVLVLGGGSVAYAHTQSGSGSYRTARVTVGDVDQTLALSGTITAAARRDLSFGAAGTVKTVKVAAGDSVSSGDTLVTLDPTALRAAVIKAKATLAKAKAQLETDQSSQASTVTDAATPSSASAPSTSKTPSTSTPTATPTAAAPSDKTGTKASKALAAALRKLGAQQAAVTSAQTAATGAISSARSALARQQEACKTAEAPAPSDPADADGDGSDASAEEPSASDVPDACATALDDVQSEQAVVSDKQDALQKALEDLSATLTSAVKSIGDTTTTPSTATPTATPTDSTGGTSTGGTSSGSSIDSSSPSSSASQTSTAAGAGGGGGTVTAATLAKDQATIDTAVAQLTEARRELASATLTAPFSGEILSVSVAKGDTVGASDVAVVIAGDGGTTVTTTVTLDQIDDVKTSQAAVMTPVGASKTVAGTVSSIGLLPGTTTDSTTATYPVTIDLDTDVAAPEGSAVSIQLVVGTAEKALTVPSSAVSTTGRTTVTLLTDDEPVVTPVTVGVVGATRTSVTAGLKKGQVVVIADLDAALPSGDSASTRLPGAGGGGMPSGAGGPGGRRG